MLEMINKNNISSIWLNNDNGQTDDRYAVSVISSPSESKWLWYKHNISSHSEMNHDNYIQPLSLQTSAIFRNWELSTLDSKGILRRMSND